jgi:hypothetical protein
MGLSGAPDSGEWTSLDSVASRSLSGEPGGGGRGAAAEWRERTVVWPTQLYAAQAEASPAPAELTAELAGLTALAPLAAQASQQGDEQHCSFLLQLNQLLLARVGELTGQLLQKEALHRSLQPCALHQRLSAILQRLEQLKQASLGQQRPIQLSIATLRPLDTPYAHVDQVLHAYAHAKPNPQPNPTSPNNKQP